MNRHLRKKLLSYSMQMLGLLGGVQSFAQTSGPSSSQTPYVIPVGAGIVTKSILSVNDSIGGYPMVGIPDGLGAFDNGNGTFTVLMNHELGGTAGRVRDHGAKGSFVSKWVINKSTLAVSSGSDLIKTLYLYSGGSYVATAAAINRLCSGDLPAGSAFYNNITGMGTKERIFMNGEETGAEGRAFGHIVTGSNAGKSYELPYLGKFSWENSVASPHCSNKTIVAGLDDAGGGQVYFYIGAKTNTGNEIQKAGLSNGKLFGLKLAGITAEVREPLNVPAGTAFSLFDFGDVKNKTGATLESESNTNGVMQFARPEDGLWDPNHPADFYFVTTDRFDSSDVVNYGIGKQIGRSRLWRLRFTDINNPEMGGTIEAVLNGTEGPIMMDNIGIDKYGHISIQEDPGGQSHSAKIWQYDIATDAVKLIARHDPARFGDRVGGTTTAPTTPFNNDEESSGIIDMQDILGAGWYLLDVQAHYNAGGTSGLPLDMVQGGQLLAMYNPDTYNSYNNFVKGPSTTQSPYLIPVAEGVVTKAILSVNDSIGGYPMVGIPDGLGAFDNNNGTFTLLMNHELGGTAGRVRDHGTKGSFVSKWVINKSTLAVTSGSDLIQTLNLWNGAGYTSHNAGSPAPTPINRLCSGDLPAGSAFYNSATMLGTQERIFMNGEETGAEGRAFGHIVTGTNAGTSYELPYLGKFSWENSVASPYSSNKTIVAGLDDAGGGQVYFYIGTKTNTGNEIQKAGLSNGKLFGLKLAGITTEVREPLNVPAGTAFSLFDFGDVKNKTGATLESESNTNGVMQFARPEDGLWDPNHPADFYFVTTDRFDSSDVANYGSGKQIGRSRLWRLRFTNINNPEMGGTFEAVLNGTEGPIMMDNIGIDKYGHISIQEDPGGQSHSAKIWQYDIATDEVKIIAKHDPARFGDRIGGVTTSPTAPFNADEESSGIIDMEDILGAGWYLLDVQAHYNAGGTSGLPLDMVQGGQLLAMYNPDTKCGSYTWFFDNDRDGYGNVAKAVFSATRPGSKYVSFAGDCKDWDPAVNPGAAEACDGIDNNCNGLVDEGCVNLMTWYRDGDADGYGNPNPQYIKMSAVQPYGWVANDDDCRDWDANVYPGKGCPPASIVSTQPKAMVEISSEISVFPNPTRDVFTVVLNGFETGKKVEMQLIQADGKAVMAQSLIPTVMNQQVRLDAGRMNTGYYLLQVKQGINQQTKKVIVVR